MNAEGGRPSIFSPILVAISMGYVNKASILKDDLSLDVTRFFPLLPYVFHLGGLRLDSKLIFPSRFFLQFVDKWWIDF